MAYAITLSPIEPGSLQVYSNIKPTLNPGNYEINIKQDFGSKKLHSSRAFEVVGPAQSLGPSDIHSYYPLAGTSEHANILPHISFRNPFLPWARPSFAADPSPQRRTPWLGLVSFEMAELQLQPSHIQSLARVATSRTARIGTNSAKPKADPLALSSTGALSLTFAELMDLKASGGMQVALKGAAMDENESDALLRTILLTREVAVTLFGDHDGAATSWSSPAEGKPPNVERYAHLAHLRHVNTTGSRDAASSDVVQETVSTLVCHRTGSTKLDAPRKMVVHVISLDALDELHLNSGPDAFTLISLHSWTYWCVPESHARFQDTMKELAKNILPLTYSPKQILEVLGTPGGGDRDWLDARIKSGYTIIRSIVQTGESTMGIVRGCFSPYRPTNRSRGPSNDGYSLQILDREAGIMDLTYSMAWNLGRTLALADQALAQALVRIRAEMHKSALTQAKKEVDTAFMSKADLVHQMNKVASEISEAVKTMKDMALNGRWRSASGLVAMSLRQEVSWFSEIMRSKFDQNLKSFAGQLRDHHQADMHTISQWVLSTLRLQDIPPYYLIPDLRMLPHESVRTFYIDDTWTDAVLDGALSVGNHYDDDDIARTVIKKELNIMLASEKRIARWGMLIRSEQMSENQELIVSIRGAKETFLSSTKLGNEMRLILCSKYVEDPDFSSGSDKAIVLSQPPHQQRFSLATLTDAKVESAIFGLESSEANLQEKYKHWPATWNNTDGTRSGSCAGKTDLPPIYNWKTRSLIPDHLSKACSTVLHSQMPGSDLLNAESDGQIGSAALALQLNDNVFDLVISATSCVNSAPNQAATPTRSIPIPAERNRDHNGGSVLPKPEPVAAPVVHRVPTDPKPVVARAGPLGAAAQTIIMKDAINASGIVNASVWPVLTPHKAIPSSHPSALDLVFALPLNGGNKFTSAFQMVLTIPTGPGETDLFMQASDAPRVRLLSKSVSWKASVVVPDLQKRDSLRLVISTHDSPSEASGVVRELDDHPSFVLSPVANITGRGIVTIACSYDARMLGNNPWEYYGGHDTFTVVKEAVAQGEAWP